MLKNKNLLLSKPLIAEKNINIHLCVIENVIKIVEFKLRVVLYLQLKIIYKHCTYKTNHGIWVPTHWDVWTKTPNTKSIERELVQYAPTLNKSLLM